jgi:hypothetical protein
MAQIVAGWGWGTMGGWNFRRSTNGCSGFSYRTYFDRGYFWGLCVFPHPMVVDVDKVDGAEDEGMTTCGISSANVWSILWLICSGVRSVIMVID